MKSEYRVSGTYGTEDITCSNGDRRHNYSAGQMMAEYIIRRSHEGLKSKNSTGQRGTEDIARRTHEGLKT